MHGYWYELETESLATNSDWVNQIELMNGKNLSDRVVIYVRSFVWFVLLLTKNAMSKIGLQIICCLRPLAI